MKVHLDRKCVSSYEIHIGKDIIDRVGLILAKNAWASRYFILSDSRVAALYGEAVSDILGHMNLKIDLIDFPGGEASKNIHSCLGIAEKLSRLGADRTSAIVALGGGVTGDIAGFIASIYMRGIPCIQIPTTLLAQVDSSIGGKTGIDMEAGKNLLGTFSQPKAVFIDVSFLKTLPDTEFRSGLAEVLKYGIIESPDLLTLIDSHVDELRSRDSAFLERLITLCCRIKKNIVELDERETGLRRILNFGHTLGHAIEAVSSYTVSHGEAVSIGIAAAAMLSERMKYLPPEDTVRILSLIRNLGLNDRIPANLASDAILAGLRADKKKQGDVVPFVLLKNLGIPFMNGGVQEPLIRKVIEELKA
jgi:3-dehydroquinate synthase